MSKRTVWPGPAWQGTANLVRVHYEATVSGYAHPRAELVAQVWARSAMATYLAKPVGALSQRPKHGPDLLSGNSRQVSYWASSSNGKPAPCSCRSASRGHYQHRTSSPQPPSATLPAPHDRIPAAVTTLRIEGGQGESRKP